MRRRAFLKSVCATCALLACGVSLKPEAANLDGCHPIQDPFPLRFRTLNDASMFLKTRDKSLALYPIIKTGKHIHVSKEWRDAPCELSIWIDKDKLPQAWGVIATI